MQLYSLDRHVMVRNTIVIGVQGRSQIFGALDVRLLNKRLDRWSVVHRLAGRRQVAGSQLVLRFLLFFSVAWFSHVSLMWPVV